MLIVPNHVDSNDETTANNIEFGKIPIKSETIWENIHNFAKESNFINSITWIINCLNIGIWVYQ